MRVVSHYKGVIHLNTAQMHLDTKVQNFGIPSQVMSNHWNIESNLFKKQICKWQPDVCYCSICFFVCDNLVTCKEHLDILSELMITHR